MYNQPLIKELTETYGSPLYVFRKSEFIENYKKFQSCFKSKYAKYCLSYSYKTNYTPYICKLVKELGGYAEVVSDMEYLVAKEIGYTDDHIIYNGPYKGPLSIEFLLNGGILNIDSLDELNRICQIAYQHKQNRLSVGIRVNIDIGQHFVSRFGIDIDNGDIHKAFSMVDHVDNLEIVGLHCHVGQSRSVEAWRHRIETMLYLADSFFIEPPKYIDVGSGMFARMDAFLASQFGDAIPTFEEYAEAVAIPFALHYQDYPEENKPILFNEPGTTLINSYIDFIGQVYSIKEIKGNQFIILNCSKDNIGDICKLKKLPLEIVSTSTEKTKCENASIVGYTCLEHDVMYSGFTGDLSIGDYIIFGNVGGYSNVSKPPFISPNCAMISLGEAIEILKRSETFNDVFSTYVF